LRLLVGLGNPGPGYAGNRHNIGFMAADAIFRRHGFGSWRSRFHGLLAEGQIEGEKVILLKPMTYMNDSGRAVAAAAQFYKLEPESIIVIHDEIDLLPGKLRVKQGGGAAGHNGLRSLDAHIGPMYWRIRLGVGHPGLAELVHPYVLQNFAKEEQPMIGTLVEATAEALPLLIAGNENGFMNKVTLAVNPPKPKDKRAKDNGDSPDEGMND
jgi:peptidyl-tRNA hydrolase, PTH1 family